MTYLKGDEDMQLRDAIQIITKADARLLLYESFLRKLLVQENRGICKLCPAEPTCMQKKNGHAPDFTMCCIEFQRWQMNPKEKDYVNTPFGRIQRSNEARNEIRDLFEVFFR